MSPFSEQINALKRKFAERHPLVAPQFPLYFLSVLVRKRGRAESLQLINAIGSWFSRDAHHLIRDDDSIDIERMTDEQFRSMVMELVKECADYAISSARELDSDRRKLREFLESFKRALYGRFGEHYSAAVGLPTIGDPENVLGTAREQLSRVVGTVLGEGGRRTTNVQLRFEEDQYGDIESWTDISDEDAYILLLHNIVNSYFHNPNFFERLRVSVGQLGGAFGRIVALANPKKDCLVYSLFGEADLVAAIDRCYPNRIQRFAGNLDGAFDIIINVAIAIAHNLKVYFNDEEDPLHDEELISEGEIAFEFLDSAPPDLVVGIIPFRERIRPNKLASRFTHGRGSSRAEVAYLEYVQSVLGESGRAVIAVSERFLYSQEARGLRKTLTENDLLETVYAIPIGHKATGSINSGVIVLNKSKEMPGVITFDGDGDRYVATQVATKEVLSYKGDWRPSRYAHRDQAELQMIFDNSRYPVRTLREFVDGHIVGTAVNRADRATAAEKVELGEKLFPFVRVSDLLTGDVTHNFRTGGLHNWVKLGKSRAVDFSAALVSRIGSNLKPTYFEYQGSPVAIGHDIVALRLKPDVNLRYFLAQLNSRLVQIQLEMVSSGNVIRRISVDDLLEIKLPFPPFEEQDQIALELATLALERAEAREQIREAEVETKATEYDVVGAISHNLNQKLGSLKNDFETLIRFLRGKEQNGEKLLFSEPIRRMQQGETPGRIPSLARISDRLQDNLKSVYETVRRVEGILQKQKAEVELTEIARFVRTEVKDRFESSVLQVSVDSPKKAIQVPIDRHAFRDALDNLINNAQKHGFIEEGRVYHVNFSISKVESESGIDHVRIVYKNDGRPFPAGFSFQDYKRLAARAGKTKGSGIGGFFVTRVIDLHGGEFNEIRDAIDSSEFPVQFEILLPIE